MPETLTLTAPDGDDFRMYVARPSGKPIGGIVLIHEIWGLVPHIEDVADRLATLGYLVAAPDILSHAGLAPTVGAELFELSQHPVESVRTGVQPRLRDAFSESQAPGYAEWAVGALRAVVDWVDAQPGVEGRIAAMGFCFGGTYAFLLAASDDRIRGAVPFYGGAPTAERIAGIRAPILALYGGQDERLMDALPEVKDAMAAAGVDFEAVVYPDAGHAFFNDTGSRYDADAAADAWRRVREFLHERI